MELRLFPLNTVLFPGATLPLHIFEDRYKEMISQCLREKSPFGVVLIREGSEAGAPARPFAVGTTAHIVRVQHLEEGRMNLVCLGGQRFRALKLLRDRPYLVGEVELLPQEADSGDDAAEPADTAGALFAEYARLNLALAGQWTRTLEMPSGPAALADFIGARLGVDPVIKQRILQEISPRRRLQIEIDLLGEAIRELTLRVGAARAARWRGFAVGN